LKTGNTSTLSVCCPSVSFHQFWKTIGCKKRLNDQCENFKISTVLSKQAIKYDTIFKMMLHWQYACYRLLIIV